MKTTILALDGHDGAGKTTLARLLADALGGTYVRTYDCDTGPRFLDAVGRGDFQRADRIAREAIDQVLATNPGAVLICDRHWMTVFSRLPEPFWTAWLPLPPTTLCWCDEDTTLRRLAERVETALPLEYHRDFLRRYWDLAPRFGCHVLRTDQAPIDTCLDRLLAWARPYI